MFLHNLPCYGGFFCPVFPHPFNHFDGFCRVHNSDEPPSFATYKESKPNPTTATPIHKIIKNKPIIKVPGCPPIGEVMAGVIVHILAFNTIPQLDGMGRPKAFYSSRVHDTCYRRPNYDAGLFAESFDDENAKKGFCLYKLGC